MFISLSKAAKENSHFKIYNKKNLPTRWHVNNTIRTGPIVAVADVGYGFQNLWDDIHIYEERYNIPSELLLKSICFQSQREYCINLIMNVGIHLTYDFSYK